MATNIPRSSAQRGGLRDHLGCGYAGGERPELQATRESEGEGLLTRATPRCLHACLASRRRGLAHESFGEFVGVEGVGGVSEDFGAEGVGAAACDHAVVDEGFGVEAGFGGVVLALEEEEDLGRPGAVGGVVGLGVLEVPAGGVEGSAGEGGVLVALGEAVEGVEAGEFALGPDFEGAAVAQVGEEGRGAGGVRRRDRSEIGVGRRRPALGEDGPEHVVVGRGLGWLRGRLVLAPGAEAEGRAGHGAGVDA